MKRLLLYATVSLVTGCNFLGIGKQCYTCTTAVSATATGPTVTNYVKDVCGNDERNSYTADNRGLKNGVYLTTSCKEK